LNFASSNTDISILPDFLNSALPQPNSNDQAMLLLPFEVKTGTFGLWTLVPFVLPVLQTPETIMRSACLVRRVRLRILFTISRQHLFNTGYGTGYCSLLLPF
jgi:hypothetical protein